MEKGRRTTHKDGHILDARRRRRTPSTRKEAAIAPERDFLQNTADNILAAVQLIAEGGEGVEEIKGLLGDLLRARERNYFTVASVYNPQIEEVDDLVYAVRGKDGRRLYGSVISIIDAIPEVTDYMPVADVLRFPVNEFIDTSVVVLSGSSAQPRVQEFPSDLDLAEHIKITGMDREQAIRKFVEGIHASVFGSKEVTNGIGKDITIDFKCMRMGEYPVDVDESLRGHRVMRWDYGEIINGAKKVLMKDGTTRVITLEEAAGNPKYLRFEYLGITGEEVFEITKVGNITITASDGTHIVNGDSGVPAFKEVYLDDPRDFDLLPQVVDPDRFVNFVTQNLEQARAVLSDQSKVKILPGCKRIYNIFKAIGDVQAAEELSEIFQSDAAKIKQLLGRHRPLQEAIAAGAVPSTVEKVYLSRIWEFIFGYQDQWPTASKKRFAEKGFLNDKEIRATAIVVSDRQVRAFLQGSPVRAKIEHMLPGVSI